MLVFGNAKLVLVLGRKLIVMFDFGMNGDVQIMTQLLYCWN